MTTWESVACKLCGSTKVRQAYSEKWRGQEYAGYYCGKCDVYETLGNVADLSPQYHSLTEDEIEDQYLFQSSFAHKGAAYKQWQDLMIQEGGPLQGRLLDIGCGIGGFLDFAVGQGVECHGFDAAAAQVAYARRTHPNVVHAITMDDYLTQLPAALDFRYFTMWDVLEHIPAPLPMLTSVREVMSADALLYISVPSGGTIPLKQVYYKLTGVELSLYPWEHVFYYTPKSLHAVLERAGLRVVSNGGVATYERPMSPREAIRRVVTKGLSRTKLATQLYAVVRRG